MFGLSAATQPIRSFNVARNSRRTRAHVRVHTNEALKYPAAAIAKVLQAAHHGGGLFVPTGPRPDRYCYTACVDEPMFGGDPPNTCVGNLFDPPQISAGAYTWVLDGTASSARITVGSETVTLPIQGRAAFHAPRCLPNQTCPAELPFVNARVASPFVLGGKTFSNVVFQNPVPLTNGQVSAINSTVSGISFPAGAQIFATADVSGEADRLGTLSTATDRVTGGILWATRQVVIDATFTDSTNATTVVLHIVGSLPNRTPLAEAGADRTLECTSTAGATVALSGVSSSDPDNPQGSYVGLSYNWLRVAVNGSAPASAVGRDVSFVQTNGTRDYDLTVRDPSGSSTTDSVRVTVRDATAPLYNGSALRTCIPRDGSLRLFRASYYASAFTDMCTPNLSYSVVSITSSQVNATPFIPDVRSTAFGSSGTFCVRGQLETSASRTYSITIRATDLAGNSRLGTFPIIVPTGTCSAPSLWPAKSVADTTTEC